MSESLGGGAGVATSGGVGVVERIAFLNFVIPDFEMFLRLHCDVVGFPFGFESVSTWNRGMQNFPFHWL